MAARQPSAATVRAQELGAYSPTDRLEKTRAAVTPFAVEMSDGQVFVFNDPKRLPYRQLLRFNDGTSMDDAMQMLLGPDQYAALTEHPDVDAYWMEDVFTEFRSHYGLPNAPGEARASSA